MKKLNNLFRVMVLTIATILLIACGSDSTSDDPKDAKINIVYPDGVEAVAITTFAKVMLEDHGYTNINTTYLDVGVIWTSLSREGGGVDLYLDAWLPFTQKSYWEKYGDKLERIGILNPAGTSGLVVPAYVEPNSIDELNDYVDLFNGEIFGLGAGSGTNAKTNEMIKAYGLNYTQRNTSEAAMMAELRRALNNKEAVIITGWTPHYKWSKYDLKMLEDPKDIYGVENMEIIARGGFSEDHPELTRVLKNFKLSQDQLNELIMIIEDAGGSTPNLDGATQFYKKYQSQFDQWFE